MMHDLMLAGMCAVIWVTGFVVGWAWRSARRERRQFDAQIEGYEAVLAERQAPKHAKGEPWRSGSPAAVAANASGTTTRSTFPSPTTRSATAGATNHAKTTATGRTPSALDAAVARHPSGRKRVVTGSHTSAADIPPVFAPRPGTVVPFRPQPGRTSGAGTQTMPRLTDTGEIRKLADDWAERTRREQAVWAQEYHDRCEADRQEAGLTP